MYSYRPATEIAELEQILELQRANLPERVDRADWASEGFVTVSHDLPLIAAMNERCAHTLAMAEGRVVGYALAMHLDFEGNIALLVPMIARLRKALGQTDRILIMGQICIDAPHRGRGVFAGLYAHMAETLPEGMLGIATAVDARNERSLAAHLKTGFTEVQRYTDQGALWHLLYWQVKG